MLRVQPPLALDLYSARNLPRSGLERGLDLAKHGGASSRKGGSADHSVAEFVVSNAGQGAKQRASLLAVDGSKAIPLVGLSWIICTFVSVACRNPTPGRTAHARRCKHFLHSSRSEILLEKAHNIPIERNTNKSYIVVMFESRMGEKTVQ